MKFFRKLERWLLFTIPGDIFFAALLILDALEKRFTLHWWVVLILWLICSLGGTIDWILEKLEERK